MKLAIIPATVLIIVGFVFARQPQPGTAAKPAVVEDGISVYFSPKGGCEAAVVAQIKHAAKSVDMQAYSFTNYGIGQALADAKARGVAVRIVLDTKASKEESREPDFVASHGIPTWTDAKHPIAHNKVIIIDGATVITGSFNFTEQAENSNAENMLVITGKPKLAMAYEKNFEEHLGHSEP